MIRIGAAGSSLSFTPSRFSAIWRSTHAGTVSPLMTTRMIGNIVVSPPVKAKPTKNAAVIDATTIQRYGKRNRTARQNARASLLLRGRYSGGTCGAGANAPLRATTARPSVAGSGGSVVTGGIGRRQRDK